MKEESRGQRILVLSGPNLNRLGKREPGIYGSRTLDDIHRELGEIFASEDVSLDFRQSNHEGTLLDWIGGAEDDGFSAIVINPGAYTHTSYALYDAIRGTSLPVVEVHLSNPDAREEFRRESKLAPACLGRVAGFGWRSYALGIEGVLRHLDELD